MKHDRDGGKRTNWLLIKHRDEFAKEGKANDILDEDQSVASGRTMEQIAAGKGKAPKPFMTGEGGRSKADAVWHRTAATPRRRAGKTSAAAQPAKTPASAKARRQDGRRDAGLRRAAALHARSSGRPAATAGCHEIKFDGYRVQLRVEDGKAALKTRKGLDWTEKFQAIAEGRRQRCRTASIDGEIVALDDNGAPDFAALQARCPTARPTTWSSSPSICCSPTARTCAAAARASARRG